MDIVVNATGKIVPGSYTKTISSVEVANIRAIHVREGQVVQAGDLLVELDASVYDTDRDKALEQRAEAMLLMARSQALIAALDSGSPPKLPAVEGLQPGRWEEAKWYLDGQYQDYRARLQQIEGDIARYGNALPLATQRARDYHELANNHDVALHAYLEKEQARIDLAGQLAEARNRRRALTAETRKMAFDANAEGARVLNVANQDALRADAHRTLLKLTAPVTGTVQQLNIHTVGGVVPAVQPLMQIVPLNDKVMVEATLENKDVGFVKEGQRAAVKVDTFEYTKYGTIPALVKHVSRDAIQDEKRGLLYTALIALDKSTLKINGRDVPLSAGMSVNVEIKTGTRRVIEYVLSPLLQHTQESLRER